MKKFMKENHNLLHGLGSCGSMLVHTTDWTAPKPQIHLKTLLDPESWIERTEPNRLPGLNAKEQTCVDENH